MDIFKTKLSGDNNIIHETALIDKSVKLGKDNYFGPYCIITGDVEIGDGNRFESHVCIGSAPEHTTAISKGINKGVTIGNYNTFRESATVNGGFERRTLVLDLNLILRGAYIGHDSIINNNCTISCNALIGGHSEIRNHVNMGLGAICHQFSLLGEGAMIGMGTVIPKKKRILPYKTYVGNPVRELKDNLYLIEKENIKHDYIIELRKKYNGLFNDRFYK